MRRTSLILIAIATMAAAKPASWTAAQRACPLSQAPSGLASELVKSMLPGAAEQEITDEAAEKLASLAVNCARETKVRKARLDSYVELATWQLTSTGLGDAIKAKGLEPRLLDTAMNVGPGRANPGFENLSDAQLTQLMVALKAQGIDVEALHEEVWQLVGSYLEATSRANRTR